MTYGQIETEIILNMKIVRQQCKLVNKTLIIANISPNQFLGKVEFQCYKCELSCVVSIVTCSINEDSVHVFQKCLWQL